jgi:Tn3 transposase DDE domain
LPIGLVAYAIYRLRERDHAHAASMALPTLADSPGGLGSLLGLTKEPLREVLRKLNLALGFANDQFAGQGGVVVPGTPRDAPYLLAGLLEQWSGQPPIEVITDSGSYTDQVFGTFWLLGYRFSPRLADVGDARLWRLDRSANYGPLTGLARQRINRELIARNWDDLLRLAGSLKMGTIGAVELFGSLQGGGRTSALGRALTELGRGPKTLHLLSHFDDKDQRRHIGRQLSSLCRSPRSFVRQVPLPPALPGPAWINKPTEVPIAQ